MSLDGFPDGCAEDHLDFSESSEASDEPPDLVSGESSSEDGAEDCDSWPNERNFSFFNKKKQKAPRRLPKGRALPGPALPARPDMSEYKDEGLPRLGHGLASTDDEWVPEHEDRPAAAPPAQPI